MTLEDGPDAFYSVGWPKHELTVVTGLMGVAEELVYTFVTRGTVGIDRARIVDVLKQEPIRRTLSSIGHNPEHHLLHLSAPSAKHDSLVAIPASPDKGLVDLDVALKFLWADIHKVQTEASVPTS